ncbi:MAG: hypothetical protein JWR69_1139 [Pedosphaera sp.]|nr:hypothetical protein [Pedosphaera sp.]
MGIGHCVIGNSRRGSLVIPPGGQYAPLPFELPHWPCASTSKFARCQRTTANVRGTETSRPPVFTSSRFLTLAPSPDGHRPFKLLLSCPRLWHKTRSFVPDALQALQGLRGNRKRRKTQNKPQKHQKARPIEIWSLGFLWSLVIGNWAFSRHQHSTINYQPHTACLHARGEISRNTRNNVALQPLGRGPGRNISRNNP